MKLTRTALTTIAIALLAPAAPAIAAPVGVDAYAYEMTINLSEIADELDSIPACAMEDGSDIIPAVAGRCIWTNDGNAWLTYEDRSYLIVDDTATPGNRCFTRDWVPMVCPLP